MFTYFFICLDVLKKICESWTFDSNNISVNQIFQLPQGLLFFLIVYLLMFLVAVGCLGAEDLLCECKVFFRSFLSLHFSLGTCGYFLIFSVCVVAFYYQVLQRGKTKMRWGRRWRRRMLSFKSGSHFIWRERNLPQWGTRSKCGCLPFCPLLCDQKQWSAVKSSFLIFGGLSPFCLPELL